MKESTSQLQPVQDIAIIMWFRSMTHPNSLHIGRIQEMEADYYTSLMFDIIVISPMKLLDFLNKFKFICGNAYPTVYIVSQVIFLCEHHHLIR